MAATQGLSTTLTEADPGSPRADMLLRGMHKVFSHDLPNQMVALQSLLQLLSLEESGRLSDDGREYVRRLQSASRRAGEMVRFLKEMGRLNALVPKTETIELASMARELQGELQRLHPNREFDFEWNWSVTTIPGDLRAYLQAIVELTSSLLSSASKRCRFTADSSEKNMQVVVTFHVEGNAETTARARSVGPHLQPQVVAERMDVILARAWLAVSDAALSVTALGPAEIAFSIIVPRR